MVYSAEELLETIDARLTASPRAALSQMAQELAVSRRARKVLRRRSQGLGLAVRARTSAGGSKAFAGRSML